MKPLAKTIIELQHLAFKLNEKKINKICATHLVTLEDVLLTHMTIHNMIENNLIDFTKDLDVREIADWAMSNDHTIRSNVYSCIDARKEILKAEQTN